MAKPRKRRGGRRRRMGHITVTEQVAAERAVQSGSRFCFDAFDPGDSRQICLSSVRRVKMSLAKEGLIRKGSVVF